VFVPKFRYKLFVSLEIKSYCELALRETVLRLVAWCMRCRLVMIMCIFSLGCTQAAFVSELVSLLKCNSARRLFLVFSELKGKLWKGHL
jgi:hypothetical protein